MVVSAGLWSCPRAPGYPCGGTLLCEQWLVKEGLPFGGVRRPGGEQEADVLSRGGAGVVEPSSIMASILSGDCLVSFSMSPRLPQWRTGS